MPLAVHPEVEIALRPYEGAAEALLFDLGRMDRFLAQFRWHHRVSGSGQVSVGQTSYYIGKAHRSKVVTVGFEAGDRHFVFTDQETGQVLRRCRAKGLEAESITIATKSQLVPVNVESEPGGAPKGV